MIEIAPKETEIRANWYDATLYCFSLNIDGKTGWRLPSKDEIAEIHESKHDFENYWYWSSTEGSGNYAWVQFMSDGSQYNANKNFGYGYVRAIRDLKDNS